MARRVATALLLFAVAGHAAGEREDFQKGLKKVTLQVSGGRGRKARASLDRLLEEHRDQNYVRIEKQRVCDLMKQAAFLEATGKIDVRKLIGGEVLKCDTRTGHIRVSFSAGDLAAWIKTSQGLAFPAPFLGPHRIEVIGTSYPEDKYGIQIVACSSEETYFRVSFGAFPPGRDPREGTPPKAIEQVLRGKSRTLSQGFSRQAPGRGYRVGVLVNRNEISLLVNGRARLKARKLAKRWGKLTLLNVKGVQSIHIEGRVDPSWLRELVGAERNRRLKEFEATFRERGALPGWLFKWPPRDPKLARPKREPWPVPLTDRDGKFVERVTKALEAGAFRVALARCREPIPLASYLRTRVRRAMGDLDAALVDLAIVLKAHPGFVPARILRARLLSGLGRFDEATAELEPLLGKYPGGADLHAGAARIHLRAGRIEAAVAVTEKAMLRGVVSPGLERVRRNLHRALRGPLWPRRFVHKSKHYQVETDMDRQTAGVVARTLERNYAGFVTRLERVPDAKKRRFMVYVFASRAGYARYCSDLYGKEHAGSAGLYDTELKQLLICNAASREDLLATVRHEGFHQYLDRLMVAPPLWFNEGLAGYFAMAKVVKGKWTLGRVNRSYAQLARAPFDLRTFLELGDRAFMADPANNYARAWAFVHFLRPGAGKGLFQRFWDAFREVPSRKLALQKALEGLGPDQLQQAFKAHLDSLR